MRGRYASASLPSLEIQKGASRSAAALGAPVQSGRKAVGAKRDSSARDPVAGGGEGKEGVAC